MIGKESLPAVLGVIKAEPSSAVARENAVAVWMEIFRSSDEQPKGVARLRQEEVKTNDDATQRRLKWAVLKAVTHCNPPEAAACREAARAGAP